MHVHTTYIYVASSLVVNRLFSTGHINDSNESVSDHEVVIKLLAEEIKITCHIFKVGIPIAIMHTKINHNYTYYVHTYITA